MGLLDDYLNISPAHFAHIPSSRLSLSVFNDAIPPFSHPRTTQEQKTSLITRLKPFEVLSTMRERTPFPASLLEELPNLKLLLATGTQFETFDLTAARKLGITVAAAPGKGRVDGKTIPGRAVSPKLDIKKGGSHPTTQHAWALILALARNVATDDAVMKCAHPVVDSTWQTGLAKGLTGSTLGVVGLGRLGAAVGRIAALGFGMRVVCWSENLTQERADRKAEEMGMDIYGPDGTRTFRAVSKDELFREADVVSLHYVLSERSRGLVGEREIGAMKSNALLVNTSRGALIDEDALYEALSEGRIGGAALDVFDLEPLPVDSRWRSKDWGFNGRSRLLLTPHMGYVEDGIMHNWYEETVENLERYLDGKEILHRIN
ncbi:D-3-phosphoglycerate dehydrogenase [Penicillium angulare]|uniref:D-3-phosphoglycerate dehydrogenase n=1 Tax=Penicillium angulare TaxID=116970 RepID=UPI002541E1E4|nr:D-3-phosphoglycerate dehydrogenase [Penicillium angulare]KAJ5273147.1 D-3-phosphoglycerate dehydrogenase [Penicillium angulare]